MTIEELRFADFLAKEDILCGFPAADRREALDRLIRHLHERYGGFNPAGVLDAALEREALAPTIIAPALALPHVRLEELDQPRMAVAVSATGVPFAEGEPPVHILILVLTPKLMPSLYLRIVAALSSRLGSEDVRRRLMACDSPDWVFDFFCEGKQDFPPYLCAANLMDTAYETLREGDTLEAAIRRLCTGSVDTLPVVDEAGDLRGAVGTEDLIRLSLPEHLLWMTDLTPILHFQPFAELLKKDNETRVADFMREDLVTIAPDAPAIELARLFATGGSRYVFVVRARRLLGVVSLRDFTTKLFWA